MSRARMEAFSDGVLAVAITLLVLDLHVQPTSGGHLLGQLLAAWPSFVAFLVSFVVIGVIWVNHHAIVRLADSVDRWLLFANLLLLLFVTTLPFASSTLSGAIAEGDAADIRVAAAVYGGVMTGMAVAFTLLYGRITSMLVASGAMDQRARRARMLRFSAGVLLYPLMTVIGLFYAPAMLAAFAALSIYYLFNQTGVSDN
ncbi:MULTISPECIES: TMEM175 family protein [unclassified Leifsonia]|uniref:TMEM175 family protein n=1 Tax=unclassified Leifsonia TaxID=2663824 RepID=UPI0008A7764A|nr:MULTISPECIES: TMEM175 family protein [unclassified Leifsonia]SEI11103.1 Uncharacterized membrane protein [Leifsonia sp. CL154]SFL89340.1 Uncharacterized membrane protein [Leifsonia sp. CL147]